MKTKALLLFSGGLDSILASQALRKTNCEVIALTFTSPFFDAQKAKIASQNLGIKIIVEDISKIHFKLLRNPPHGFGKNMNPCIDCHALMFSLAKKIAKREGCEIIASGEVLGQRPFSQNKQALQTIEKIAKLEGKILRVLSAKLLPPTIYKKEGLISREKLLSIKGKSRKPQLALAKEWGIESFPTPAGGCLLTEASYSTKLRELLARNPKANHRDAKLIQMGRVFFLGEKSFTILGRNKEENESLEKIASAKDYLIEFPHLPSPIALLVLDKGDDFEKLFQEVCALIKNYSKHAKEVEGKIEVSIKGKAKAKYLM